MANETFELEKFLLKTTDLHNNIEKDLSQELRNYSPRKQYYKTKCKIVLDFTVNLILPAIDECTDIYSGIRYFM